MCKKSLVWLSFLNNIQKFSIRSERSLVQPKVYRIIFFSNFVCRKVNYEPLGKGSGYPCEAQKKVSYDFSLIYSIKKNVFDVSGFYQNWCFDLKYLTKSMLYNSPSHSWIKWMILSSKVCKKKHFFNRSKLTQK